MLEYGLAFARVRDNLHRVKIHIQPVTRFYLHVIFYMPLQIPIILLFYFLSAFFSLVHVRAPFLLLFWYPCYSLSLANISSLQQQCKNFNTDVTDDACCLLSSGAELLFGGAQASSSRKADITL